MKERYQRLKGQPPKGQNLVELVLTFPLLIAMVFGVIEIGRVWQAYEGAKMAAMEGAYTASVYHNPTAGVVAVAQRLQSARLELDPSSGASPIKVEPIDGGKSYQATVNVRFRPVFGGLQIPTFSGDKLTLIPNDIAISYREVRANAIY